MLKYINNKNFNQLPKTPGVYFFTVGGMSDIPPIYIGKAVNIQSRVKNHFSQPSYRDNLFINKVDKIGFFETGSEIEALILEANLIKKYHPKFNVVWRDDKNYFFVAIAQNSQKIPYVYITHQPSLKIVNCKLKISYIGPFVGGMALKNALKFLRKAFPFYTSSKHPKNKCTWCHLGLCPGPNPNLKEYRKNIKKLILILQGKKDNVLSSLRKEMNNFSKKNKFEEAGKIRDTILDLQQVMAHSEVIEKSKIINPLSKIECYDISNIQGKFATGSMVAFINGKPYKNSYRKFKIRLGDKPNDIAMLKEILIRRFNHKDWKYPEVILIDGGKAQLNMAIETKNYFKNPKIKNLKIISIAKGKQELFIDGQPNPIPLKDLSRETQNLILQLDDEAHRFAVTYHKKLRKKELLH